MLNRSWVHRNLYVLAIGVAAGLITTFGCGKAETPPQVEANHAPAVEVNEQRPADQLEPAPSPVTAKPAADPAVSAEQEKQHALALVEQLGGKYEEDPNRLGKPIVSLNLAGTKVSAEGMEQLKSLTSLERLDLAGTRVGDEGLAAVRHMVDLRRLHLWTAVGITDRGLEHLSGLTKLEWLGIGATGRGITGAGFVHLKDHHHLKFLAVDLLPELEDQHLQHLSGLVNLEELRLNGAEQVTDAGIEHLKSLTNLKALGLNDTQISDEGLDLLSQLSKLERLSLNNTSITDAGLKKLEAWRQLKVIDLAKTKVTDDGIAELQKARPELKVNR
jgi:hypothetical protein